MNEQAELLRQVGIASEVCWPSGRRQPGTSFRGYKRAAFEEARRKYDVAAPEEVELRRERLRLVGPSDWAVTGVTGSARTDRDFESTNPRRAHGSEGKGRKGRPGRAH